MLEEQNYNITRKLIRKASQIKEKLDFMDHSQQSPAPIKE